MTLIDYIQINVVLNVITELQSEIVKRGYAELRFSRVLAL
jgi:hypothetical protein